MFSIKDLKEWENTGTTILRWLLSDHGTKPPWHELWNKTDLNSKPCSVSCMTLKFLILLWLLICKTVNTYLRELGKIRLDHIWGSVVNSRTLVFFPLSFRKVNLKKCYFLPQESRVDSCNLNIETCSISHQLLLEFH